MKISYRVVIESVVFDGNKLKLNGVNTKSKEFKDVTHFEDRKELMNLCKQAVKFYDNWKGFSINSSGAVMVDRYDKDLEYELFTDEIKDVFDQINAIKECGYEATTELDSVKITNDKVIINGSENKSLVEPLLNAGLIQHRLILINDNTNPQIAYLKEGIVKHKEDTIFIEFSNKSIKSICLHFGDYIFKSTGNNIFKWLSNCIISSGYELKPNTVMDDGILITKCLDTIQRIYSFKIGLELLIANFRSAEQLQKDHELEQEELAKLAVTEDVIKELEEQSKEVVTEEQPEIK